MSKISPGETDVVILCGGRGERLKAVTGDSPKVLADINGKPFLDILIRYIACFGFKRFVLCLGYKAGLIEDYFSRQADNQPEIIFCREEAPLGTAGALKNAEPFIQGGSFVAMNGDSFIKIDFNRFLKNHSDKNASFSAALAKVGAKDDYGSVGLNSRGEIEGFSEKQDTGQGNFINAGIYIFNRDIFALIPKGVKTSLEYDVFPGMLGKGFYGYFVDQRFIDIGTPERYKKAKLLLRDIR